jgi:hypothetical protein
MLLELLSHQNYGDMSYGLDPAFRFDVSRAIYKGILRYVASQYDFDYVVQPLPVHNFAVVLHGNTAHLSWQPTSDPLEPTAEAEYYILYTRIDGGGFDTGRRIEGTCTMVEQEHGHIYSYRITAVNSGGESFDSETLSACYNPNSKGNILVVNGFTRTSAPQRFSTDSTAGFVHTYDGGVPYIEDISFIGEQTIFNRSLNRSEDDRNALGTSRRNYETQVLAGNTFDYPAIHGASILKAGYSFCCASVGAVEAEEVNLCDFHAVCIAGIGIAGVAEDSLCLAVGNVCLGHGNGCTLDQIGSIDTGAGGRNLRIDQRQISFCFIMADTAVDTVGLKALCGTDAAGNDIHRRIFLSVIQLIISLNCPCSQP